MLILLLSTYVRFVGFNDTFEKVALIAHSLAYTHEHEPSGVLVHLDVPSKLSCADTFLRIENEGDSEEPLLHVYLALMENGADSAAEGGIASVTVKASAEL